jgi:monoamine oxidase
MGQVAKVLLRFREPFWGDFTFIHAPAESLPTWWSQFPVRAPLLAGWAGGTRAETLSLESDDALLDHALESLCHIFRESKPVLEQSLAEFYTHNWHRDPFSAGAYSYIPVGGLDAESELARPLDDTLFFAGEATNSDGHFGTVHGAIATGLRAARQIIHA